MRGLGIVLVDFSTWVMTQYRPYTRGSKNLSVWFVICLIAYVDAYSGYLSRKAVGFFRNAVLYQARKQKSN